MKRVFVKIHDDESIYIFDADQVETKDWSEIYSNYGQKQFDEYQGLEVEVIEYHDGHNWQSLVIYDQTYPYPALSEIKGEEAEAILAEFKDATDWTENRGIRTSKTTNYMFEKSAWQGSYPGVRVEKI